MKLEERGRKNVSIQHLSLKHDGIPVKKTESNTIDSVSSSPFHQTLFCGL